MSTTRFGVSMETEQLAEFDDFIKENNFPSRSGAISYLVNNSLNVKNVDREVVVGSAIIVYNAEMKKANNVVQIIRKHNNIIVSNQHYNILDYKELALILFKGKLEEIKELLIEIEEVGCIDHNAGYIFI